MTFNKHAILAFLAQVASFAVGFGLINNVTQGYIIAGGTAIVNLGYLIAAAIHSHGQSLRSITHILGGSVNHGVSASVSGSASLAHSGAVVQAKPPTAAKSS